MITTHRYVASVQKESALPEYVNQDAFHKL